MKTILSRLPAFLLIIAILASCAPDSEVPTMDATTAPIPSTVTPQPTSTLVTIPERWSEISLIAGPSGLSHSNATDNYDGTPIPQSAVTLDKDVRWVIDMKVGKLKEDIGEASTGILLQGFREDGSQPVLFFVYQVGAWNLGYAATAAPDYTFGEYFSQLNDPSQHFEITISNGGKRLEIRNDHGFEYQHEFKEPLFANTKSVEVQAQFGPHTTLDISSLSIYLKQAGQIVVASVPSPMPSNEQGFEYILHVSPSGDDNNPGTEDLPFATIEHARDVVSLLNTDMTGSILVLVHGGVYEIKRPISFSIRDSGNNGFKIIYRAAEGETPVISGGVAVSGWQTVPNSPMWKTILLPETVLFRNLYVNGVRASRAASEGTITGLRDTPERDGFLVSSSKLPEISRPQDMELHWIYDWKDIRLRVRDIEVNQDGAKNIRMLQPYFSYAVGMGSSEHPWFPKYNVPFYLENALELLDQPGEWYYNPETRELFYLPRDGEDMSTAHVVIPQTRSLLEIKGGAIGQEVHDLVFEGLTFAYAGWIRASEVGTFGWQAQVQISKNGLEMTPAHVYFSSAHHIDVEKCRFLYLGASGVGLGNNTEDIAIRGNLFHDISDAAIVVGHWDDAYITMPSLQSQPRNNVIENNLIDHAGVEYWGAAGINAYYVENLQIIHNEISDLPYTGISMGWGWSSTTDSTTSNHNHIAYNLITNITQHARDAGGIYTLGQQPGTVVEENVISRMGGDYACLYPDEGSAYISYLNNVCDSAPFWAHIWINSIHDIQIENTFTNVNRIENKGRNIDIKNLVFIDGQNWTPEALSIMDNAGLEDQYDFLHMWLENPGNP